MFFFFNDTATTEIYTLSLHDALPIFDNVYDPNTTRFQIIGNHRTMAAPPDCLRAHDRDRADFVHAIEKAFHASVKLLRLDRKSTRLNSSHLVISYAVFCLKQQNYHPP